MRAVVDDPVVVELHSRLHHEPDDPLPGGPEMVLCERLTMRGDSRERRTRLGDAEFLQLFLRATGHGHLCADDVHRGLAA